jgi:hypothetical protein
MSGRPDQDGTQHLGQLDAAWDKARAHWDDTMSRHFDRSYWQPLKTETQAYLTALGHLMELLSAAERATEY